jgi:signal transduction histidine kinase
VLFLTASLGVAGFGAMEAYRAERSHRAAATGVLTDYGDFAAWSFEQRATELLAARLNNTFRVARSSAAFAGGHATDACLSMLLAPTGPSGCNCAPTRVAGSWAFFTRLGDPVGTGVWNGRNPPAEAQLRILESVQGHVRSEYVDGWSFAVLPLDGGELVAYTRVVNGGSRNDDTAPRSDTLVYGIELDRRAIAEVYRWALDDGSLLPTSLTQGRPNRNVIHVDVTGGDGTVLFASRPDEEPAYPAEIPVRPIFGGGTVRASVVPEMAEQLVIGGLPADRTPVFLMIFFLAAALVQLRREDHLARLRQDFVASVSHELRTPLAQVRLFTETLRLGRTRNAEERAWALDNIDREALRLTHLVENILQFSRSERGVPTGAREPADLAAETRGAVRDFAPLVPAGRASIRVETSTHLFAEIHRDSIRQVILNFLDNAVRYGPAGQTVHVRAERTAAGAVRIVVDDQGRGVPPAERRAVFEPFRRGEGRVGSAVAGSGIGLAVVKEIAAAHGGRAWVEDAPGGGARFAFEIPPLETARSDRSSTRVGQTPGPADREVAAGVA